jgi:hypothetical protein
MKKCMFCEQEFTPQRSTAKFCSPQCKLKASRNSSPQKLDKADKLIKKVEEFKEKHDAIMASSEPDRMYMDGHEEFLAMPASQQSRVLFLMGCCRISKCEAIAQVIENDKE